MEDSSMKMILKHILNTSALLLTGIVFAGCSSSEAPIEQPINPNPTGKYVMTVNASKGSDATTRALSIDGSGKLIASWATTEDVYVKKDDSWLSGSLKPQTAGESSVLKGEVSGAPIEASDVLTLQFPRTTIDYTGQLGTLDDIAAKYDYATATTNVSCVNGNTFTSSNADFTNQQAIVKFTLQNAYGETLAVDKLTVSATGLKTSDTATGDIAITPASATDVIYAALSGISDKMVTLTATKGSDTYALTTPSTVSFANGKYYTVTAKLRTPIFSEPLTLEATVNETQITFVNHASNSVYYRKNQDGWIEIKGNTSVDNRKNITINKGDIVSFKGTNSTYYGGENSPSIACSNPCYVYGNMMSMVDATNFASLTTLPEGSDTFRGFFECNIITPDEQNSHHNLINHPTKDLLLPATTLRDGCYKSMFAGCQKLTRAPVLPAATLVDNCYAFMFDGCSSLAYIKCLATDISATNCTQNWVNDVSASASRTFVRDPNMPYDTTSGWSRGDDGIPSGWSVEP